MYVIHSSSSCHYRTLHLLSPPIPCFPHPMLIPPNLVRNCRTRQPYHRDDNHRRIQPPQFHRHELGRHLDGNHLGLTPHTYPDIAAFSAATTNQLSPNGSLITANYSQSTITSFHPCSMWYGCVAPSPYLAGSLPESCEITAAGYDASGKQVAIQVFSFAANGSVVQDQNYGVFQGFPTSVYTLAFSVSNPLTTAALVDNFIAKLYQPACAPFYTGSYDNGT